MNAAPSVFLVRKAQFSASHRLHNPDLSEAENKRLYGKCNNKNGHGHNYTLYVTLNAPVNPKTGMVINLVDLKALIQTHILDPFDHKHLNLDTEPFQTLNPTVENMVVEFWNRLESVLPNNTLYEVRLEETENNIAYYRGKNTHC